jgi:hypothetical protein
MRNKRTIHNKHTIYYLFRYTPWVVLLFLFGGCTDNVPPLLAGEARHARVVAEGTIIDINNVVIPDAATSMFEVRMGPFLRETIDAPMRITYLFGESQNFNDLSGFFGGVFVSINQSVEEGDLLMSVFFDEEEMREQEAQVLDQIRMHRAYNVGRGASMLEDIEHTRNRIDEDMTPAELDIAMIRLEGMETDFEFFMYAYERVLERYQRQLNEIRHKMEHGEELRAARSGIVTWISPRAQNSNIGASMLGWNNAITITDPTSWALDVTMPPDIIRHGETVWLKDDDDVMHEARVVSDPLVSLERKNTYSYIIMTVDRTLSRSSFGMNTSTATTSFNIFLIEETIVIPTSALNREERIELNAPPRFYVIIYDEGALRKRYVQTGFNTPGQLGMTQILDGLEPGQLVMYQ